MALARCLTIGTRLGIGDDDGVNLDKRILEAAIGAPIEPQR